MIRHHPALVTGFLNQRHTLKIGMVTGFHPSLHPICMWTFKTFRRYKTLFSYLTIHGKNYVEHIELLVGAISSPAQYNWMWYCNLRKMCIISTLLQETCLQYNVTQKHYLQYLCHAGIQFVPQHRYCTSGQILHVNSTSSVSIQFCF